MGHNVEVAATAEEGLARAARKRPDAVILDVRLPEMDGLTAMERFRQHIGTAPIIVITAFGDLQTAITAIENGAFEYVVKPFELSEIRAVVERAVRAAEPAMSEPPIDAQGMIGRTPAMHAVFKRIALAAKSDAAVLLRGESGVGKELAAAAIHDHSNRKDAPFVAVNFAALSPDLAEAELFGHVAGTYAGAHQARRGLLVQADGGTLFLDDAAEMSSPLQAKLMRALDHGEVLPIGAETPVSTKFRLISATHRDLRAMVYAGKFRSDLYLRLGTFEITLPTLRERLDDVPLLATHFARIIRGPDFALPPETLAALMRRPWHGNVRELRGAVEHALVVARSGPVLPDHLPAPSPALDAPRQNAGGEFQQPLCRAVDELAQSLLADPLHEGAVYERFLEAVEPPLLAAAMSRNGHRCAPAARALGLHRTTLKRKLDQYDIDETSLDD